MADQPVDRRVRRTRELLQKALSDLLLEKPYDAIRVQDILDRADVGRATFYAHFRNRDDLLLSELEELRSLIVQARRTEIPGDASVEDHRFAFSLPFFERFDRAPFLSIRRAANARRPGSVPAGSGRHPVTPRQLGRFFEELRDLHSLLAEKIREDIEGLIPAGTQPSVTVDILVQFTLSALLALRRYAISEDSSHTAEELDLIFHKLTMPGINAVLSQRNS